MEGGRGFALGDRFQVRHGEGVALEEQRRAGRFGLGICGSTITVFQISNNAEEFLAALEGKPFKVADVDAVSAVGLAVQAEEGVEDFVIKRLKNNVSAEQFEQFVAELL